MQQSKPFAINRVNCLCNRKATMICVNQNCKQQGFLCMQVDCQYCQNNHTTCKLFNLESLLASLQVKWTEASTFVLKQLTKIYEDLIAEIKNLERQNKERFIFSGLQKIQIQFLKKLANGENQTLLGATRFSVLKGIQNPQPSKTPYYLQILFKLESQWRREHKYLEEKLIKMDVLSSIPNPSKILGRNNIKKRFQKFFQNNITHSKLLYRASQNNFDVKRFHDLCDHLNNTLVIIKTKQNLVVGGFSSLKWKQSDGRFCSAQSSPCFTFALSTNSIKKTQSYYSILCCKNTGPIFDTDLLISNDATIIINGQLVKKRKKGYFEYQIIQWEVYQLHFDSIEQYPSVIFKNCQSYPLLFKKKIGKTFEEQQEQDIENIIRKKMMKRMPPIEMEIRTPPIGMGMEMQPTRVGMPSMGMGMSPARVGMPSMGMIMPPIRMGMGMQPVGTGMEMPPARVGMPSMGMIMGMQPVGTGMGMPPARVGMPPMGMIMGMQPVGMGVPLMGMVMGIPPARVGMPPIGMEMGMPSTVTRVQRVNIGED